jgi:hypothetical protein
MEPEVASRSTCKRSLVITRPRRTLFLIAELPESTGSEFILFEAAAALARSAFGRGFEIVACVDESIAALLAICSAEFVEPPPLEPSGPLQRDQAQSSAPMLYLAPFWHRRHDAYASLLESFSEDGTVDQIISDEQSEPIETWQGGIREAIGVHPPSIVVAMGGGPIMVQALDLVDEFLGDRTRVPRYVLRRAGGSVSNFAEWRTLEEEDRPSQRGLTFEGHPLFIPEVSHDEDLVSLAEEIRTAIGARLGGETALDEQS